MLEEVTDESETHKGIIIISLSNILLAMILVSKCDIYIYSPDSDVRSSLLQHTDVCCEAATSSGCSHYCGSKAGSQVKEQGEGLVKQQHDFHSGSI